MLRSIHFRGAFLGAALLLSCAADRGAGQGYRFPEGDTLRYRQVTESRLTLSAPGGTTAIPLTQNSVMSLSGTGEHVLAWFDSLTLVARLRGNTRSVATEAVIGQPYRLHVSPQGRIDALQAPEFPAEVAEFADLSKQFVDFLIPLPERPLAEGRQWNEAFEGDVVDGEAGYRADRSYRVTGDTVINGDTAWVIAVTQQIRQRATRPTSGGLAMSELQGQDRGTAVYSATTGRLLSRRSEGTLRGTMTLRTANRDVEMPQSFSYTSTLQLLP